MRPVSPLCPRAKREPGSDDRCVLPVLKREPGNELVKKFVPMLFQLCVIADETADSSSSSEEEDSSDDDDDDDDDDEDSSDEDEGGDETAEPEPEPEPEPENLRNGVLFSIEQKMEKLINGILEAIVILD